MGVKAGCKFCDWSIVFPAAYLSAVELAALFEHARGCKVSKAVRKALPLEPQAAGRILQGFSIHHC
jgi:hypothetical protein